MVWTFSFAKKKKKKKKKRKGKKNVQALCGQTFNRFHRKPPFQYEPKTSQL